MIHKSDISRYGIWIKSVTLGSVNHIGNGSTRRRVGEYKSNAFFGGFERKHASRIIHTHQGHFFRVDFSRASYGLNLP